jgi:CBS domain-containing protein
MKVKDVMTLDVVTVSPTVSLREAAELLVQKKISGIPVVDDGRVVGVFSERDLLFKEQGPLDRPAWLRVLMDPRAVADETKLDAATVGGAMTSPAITISPSASVSTAARRMLESTVSRLPVVKGEELVGIVTRADLVRAFVRTDDEIAKEIHDDVVREDYCLAYADVKIDVHDGVVSISGRAIPPFDAELVRTLVARVPGVVSVTTDIALL